MYYFDIRAKQIGDSDEVIIFSIKSKSKVSVFDYFNNFLEILQKDYNRFVCLIDFNSKKCSLLTFVLSCDFDGIRREYLVLDYYCFADKFLVRNLYTNYSGVNADD